MFSLTTNDPPYVHMGCTCGREYIIEEMYISFPAKKAICRFCTRDTINDVYCPACLDKQSLKDARTLDNVCPRCLMCPVCFNRTIINKHTKDDEKIHYHTCLSCKWDSLSIGITAKDMINIFANFSFSSQLKNKDKNKVYDCLFEKLKQTQEMIVKREKREMRQKKQKNLAEDREFSSTKAGLDKNTKYTKEMYKKDQKVRQKFYETIQNDLGSSITQQIIDGKIELKELAEDAFQDGFKDYLDNIDENDNELDLDKELEKEINLDELTSLEQRHKDVFSQPRYKKALKPIPFPLLPYVTKACKETEKYLVKPKISRVSSDEGLFEVDHMLMKHFPTVSIRSIDARETSRCDLYLRVTNPNMSVCIVTILPLSEKQIGKIEPNCEADFPKSAIGIDFHNDLIESGELDMSSEIKKIAPEEDDKKFIYKQEKNHVVFRIKAKMFEGLD